MSLSLNDDPERLQVLPPLDRDVRDKIIILKARKCAMPMPTGNPADDERFWNQLMAELPGFLHHLEQWQVPEALRDDCYGIAAYQHPEVVEKLQQTTPELRLLELVDRELFRHLYTAMDRTQLEPWEGSAIELEARLVNPPSGVIFEARKLLTWQNSCGTYLGRLTTLPQRRVASGDFIAETMPNSSIAGIDPLDASSRTPPHASRVDLRNAALHCVA